MTLIFKVMKTAINSSEFVNMCLRIAKHYGCEESSFGEDEISIYCDIVIYGVVYIDSLSEMAKGAFPMLALSPTGQPTLRLRNLH